MVFLDVLGGDQICISGSKKNVFAIEFHVGVSQQGSRQQTTFTQNLKAVTNPQNKPSVSGVLSNALHHRRKFSDGTTSEVIPIGESTGNKDMCTVFRVGVFVPEFKHGLCCVRL